MLAQLIGGLVGVLAAHAMFDESLLQVSTKVRAGPSLRANGAAVATSVGLYITAAYWFTASTSFANPAVRVARAFSNTFAGIRPQDVPPFIGAQLIGAVVALYVCRWLLAEPMVSTVKRLPAD